MDTPERIAPGAPGIAPRWTSAAKEGVSTAYSSIAEVWFTLSHGIVNEIYYPHVDQPNTRDLQLLVTDGETFFHEEKSDLEHTLEYPEKNALLYRLTNSDPKGRYRIVKELIVDGHSSVLLIRTRLEIVDPALEGKLRVFALLAPHLKGTGLHNSGAWIEIGGRPLLHAHREDVHLIFGCGPDFLKRSVGYVGVSDGWRDLKDNLAMNWEYTRADDGNIALMGEVDLSHGREFTLAVAFASTAQSAATQLLQALATPFSSQRDRFVAQWQRAGIAGDFPLRDREGASLVRLSHAVLLAHEDKCFVGAFVASLSIPWGEIKDDDDRGGYHLVWTRDLVHTATALLACGEKESPLRALVWLAAIQDYDGCLPQNTEINGEPYWKGIQLDEVAAPILLAWRVKASDALMEFDPWTLISRAAAFILQHGPVTGQERWEENAGYSPSTLAVLVASLVCAAEFARERGLDSTADFILAYADWLSSHVEDWTTTTQGDLVSTIPRHFIRLTPSEWGGTSGDAHPDTADIQLSNGGGKHPARSVVSGDFLQLVRLGVRAADDPVIVDSVRVIDAVLKRELPQGPGWRRYNFDGYGQKEDGSAFDGTGVGRCWPILTGERGHYELIAGRDPSPYLETLEKFANSGGMLPEQVWDDDDLPDAGMKRGRPTGSAMPLCWSHAEFLTLVRSSRDRACFDRPQPVYERYVKQRQSSAIEHWSFAHQPSRILAGKTLRLLMTATGTVRWTANQWRDSGDLVSVEVPGLGFWYVDLPTAPLTEGVRVSFTFAWPDRWEGRDFSVELCAGIRAQQ